MSVCLSVCVYVSYCDLFVFCVFVYLGSCMVKNVNMFEEWTMID